MASYLVNEDGERTHAVIPVEEYERLQDAAEKVESARGYAERIIATIGQEQEGSRENGRVEEGADRQSWPH